MIAPGAQVRADGMLRSHGRECALADHIRHVRWPFFCLDGNARAAHIRGMTLAEYLATPGQTAVGLAAQLGVSHTTVLRWAAGRVPAERVRAVSSATGIPQHELRGDLFDVPADAS